MSFSPNSTSLLLPSFENAYWRCYERTRFRDLEGFSRKKGHHEPEDHNSFASRWAEKLTREQSAEEIMRVYENCTIILGNRRSSMERSERELDCAQFRYHVEAMQDPESPGYILITRALWLKVGFEELPEHFDDIFPYGATELVVPVVDQGGRKKILEVLEQWELTLRAKLSESTDGTLFRLFLRSGLSISVDISRGEAVFSRGGVEGVRALAGAVAHDLKGLGISKQLFSEV